jgi:hypothetical protein
LFGNLGSVGWLGGSILGLWGWGAWEVWGWLVKSVYPGWRR